MGRPVNTDEVSIATATLVIALIEELTASGTLSSEKRNLIFQTSIDRLRSAPLPTDNHAATFLEDIFSDME